MGNTHASLASQQAVWRISADARRAPSRRTLTSVSDPLPVDWSAYRAGTDVDALATATLAAVNSTRFADLGNAPTFSDTLVEVEIA